MIIVKFSTMKELNEFVEESAKPMVQTIRDEYEDIISELNADRMASQKEIDELRKIANKDQLEITNLKQEIITFRRVMAEKDKEEGDGFCSHCGSSSTFEYDVENDKSECHDCGKEF